MTAVYKRDDIRFQYPENWKIDEDPSSGVPRTISVTATNGAFWAATIYDENSSPEELQKEYLETFEAEYEDLEMDPVEIKVGDQDLPALDLQFYCLDFLVHSRLIVRQIGGYKVLIAWQAEDRDFDKLEPIFEAITFSAMVPQ